VSDMDSSSFIDFNPFLRAYHNRQQSAIPRTTARAMTAATGAIILRRSSNVGDTSVWQTLSVKPERHL